MPEAQRSVGRYDLLEVIGRGGAAVVYLAFQRDLRRHVALKELASQHAADPTFAERFVEESRLAGAMSHPSIVTVHEYFEDEDIPYIAMEHLPRGSLRPYMGRLSVAQIAGVLESVLAGLAHGAERGVVHRDLKPENLLVAADGRVKISDYGVARAYNQAATRAVVTAVGTTIGTPVYMAPEQALGEQLTPATDLYSLGIVAWEMLAGTVPFEQSDTPVAVLYRQVHEPIPPIASVDPEVDGRLAAWLEKMLAKRPQERFARAETAWVALEDIVIDLLGPRWRREARLGPEPPAPDRHPLTPAQFQSTPATPEPPVAPTVTPDSVPAPPPTADETPVSAPAADTAARPRLGRSPRPPAETVDDPGAEAAPVAAAVPALHEQAAAGRGDQPPPGMETVLRPGRRHHDRAPEATPDPPAAGTRRRVLAAVIGGVLLAAVIGVIVGLATTHTASPARTTRSDTRTAPPAPSDAPVKAALATLADARSSGQRRQRAAGSNPSREASAISSIATAYAAAATRVARLSAVPAGLVATLRALGADYRSLAAAARARSRTRFSREQTQIARDERRLRALAAGL